MTTTNTHRVISHNGSIETMAKVEVESEKAALDMVTKLTEEGATAWYERIGQDVSERDLNNAWGV